VILTLLLMLTPVSQQQAEQKLMFQCAALCICGGDLLLPKKNMVHFESGEYLYLSR
jgi:hypothetical protein